MENKELINYGGAVVGGIIGNAVNQKFTKYGMAGRLGLIAVGVFGGYFLTKTLQDKGGFRNADGGCGCGGKCGGDCGCGGGCGCND
jgi:hypothetical protein